MRSHFGSQAAPADAMSEGLKKLKPHPLTLLSADNNKPDDEHRSSYLQLRVLTEYMAKEFLDMQPDKLAELLVQYEPDAYPARIRELYDIVIAAIDSYFKRETG